MIEQLVSVLIQEGLLSPLKYVAPPVWIGICASFSLLTIVPAVP